MTNWSSLKRRHHLKSFNLIGFEKYPVATQVEPLADEKKE